MAGGIGTESSLDSASSWPDNSGAILSFGTGLLVAAKFSMCPEHGDRIHAHNKATGEGGHASGVKVL